MKLYELWTCYLRYCIRLIVLLQANHAYMQNVVMKINLMELVHVPFMSKYVYRIVIIKARLCVRAHYYAQHEITLTVKLTNDH